MIEVIEKVPHDLLSLQEVKSHLRIEHSDEDLYLQDLIKVATAWVENYLNRSLLRRKLRLVWQKTQKAIMYNKIFLPFPPIINIESIKNLTKDQKIKRVSHDVQNIIPLIMVSEEHDKVEIIYNAGYGEYPNDVPPDIRHGTLMALQTLYERPSENLERAPFTQVLKCYRTTSLA